MYVCMYQFNFSLKCLQIKIKNLVKKSLFIEFGSCIFDAKLTTGFNRILANLIVAKHL